MTTFTPSAGIKETGEKARAFCKENQPAFLTMMKSLAPLIAGLLAFDALINTVFGLHQFSLGSLLVNYVTFIIIITWHRIVLSGPDTYQPVNPFKPRKSELAFMGVAILIGAVILIGMVILIALGGALGPAGAGIAGLAGLVVMYIIIIRLSLYFPAKAIDRPITLKQAFSLSEGLVWKILAASILASWRIILLTVLYAVIAGVILASLEMALPEPGFAGHAAIQLVALALALPLSLYFTPVLTILGVTVVSNYYLHALGNKTPDND